MEKTANDEALKEIVRQKYAEIADQDPALNAASCCGSGPVSSQVYQIMADDYTPFEGYVAEADLGLGCGLPTQFAQIQPGDVVIDLGSGAGNDCFVARHETGSEGKVIGIDFTDAMIRRARLNAEKLGFHNVEFRQGDIEAMPVNDNVADVVVSNCVLNLVPNKRGVFKEIFRVLKPGGHFSISDIVLLDELPPALRQEAELYAGCVSGAILKTQYLALAAEAGFENLRVQKQKTIWIPDDILGKYLTEAEIAAFRAGQAGIESITLYAEKPAATSETTLEIGAVQLTDREAVLELLKASDLPVSDLEASLSSFLVAKAAGAVVGVAALERYGPQALLRSVAVREDYRGLGLAQRLVNDLLRPARLSGIQDVYLLTTTAEGYFAKRGFARLARESTPEVIRATAQFAELCPSTAVVMHQRLEKPRLNLADLQSSCCAPGSGCC